MASLSASKPHVLILGAGLGGLTLAQALRRKNLSYEIFERDHDSHERLQGWAIALHTMLDDFHASMPADMPPFEQVNHLLPLTLVPEIALYRADSTVKMGGRDDGTGKFVRANRARLREWLSTNVPIQYGKRAVSIEEKEDGVTVHFEDGSIAVGDIVVGAEGVRSPTRKYLMGDKPDPLQTHGTATINGHLWLEGERFAEQLALGHSSYIVDFAGEDGQRYHLFVGLDRVAPDGRAGHYYWYVMWPSAAAARGTSWTLDAPAADLLAYARRATRALPAHFRLPVEATEAENIKRPAVQFHTLVLDALPAGRVTLLGDAAHAMPPFRGEGGCHAMQDALNLARAVERMDKMDRASVVEGLRAYQEEMLARGNQAVRLSAVQFDEEMDANSRVVAGRPLEMLPRETIVI